MIQPILAQAGGAGEKVTETLTRGQQMLQAAYAWAAQSAPKFATAIITAIIIYVVGAWIAQIIRSLLLRLMAKRSMDQTFATYLANILHGVIMVLVIITTLGQLGIPTAQFAALIAAAGLAIGLALQGNLSNFASGFLLVFFRPFKRGDYLTAGGAEGTVDEIGIFTTTLTTLDNKKVIVPNAGITGANITNFSANPKRLVAVPCSVAATNPPAKVRACLLRAPAGNPNLVTDPAPVAVITHLGEDKYTIELRAWCPADKYWDALFTLNEAATLSPVPINGDNRWARLTIENNGGGSGYSSEFVDGKLKTSGAWFQSRSEQGHVLEAVIPTRGRIERAAPGGNPQLLSTFDFPIEMLFYRDSAKQWWKADNLVAGTRFQPTQVTEADFDSIIGREQMRFTKRNQALIERVKNRPGNFIALTSAAPGVDTFKGIKWQETRTLITGPVVVP